MCIYMYIYIIPLRLGPLATSLLSVEHCGQLAGTPCLRIAPHPRGFRSPTDRLARITNICSHVHDVFVYVCARVHSCTDYTGTHLRIFPPLHMHTHTYIHIHMRACTYRVHPHVFTCTTLHTESSCTPIRIWIYLRACPWHAEDTRGRGRAAAKGLSAFGFSATFVLNLQYNINSCNISHVQYKHNIYTYLYMYKLCYILIRRVLYMSMSM